MIHSMTGYGQAEGISEKTGNFKVEMRSVNHRYLDLSIRMPREIQALEDKVRRNLQQALGRGRVDIFITWRTESDNSVSVTLDKPLVMAYNNALEEMKEVLSVRQDAGLDLLAHFPDVLRVEKTQADMDEVWASLAGVVDRAAVDLVARRLEEGARLDKDLRLRLRVIEEAAKKVELRAPLIVDEYRKKLEERLADYLGQVEIDPARILTEAAIFADKSNVTEELVRLASHLAGFREALQQEGPVGRKLDFLTQELFREVNTIGSKANDYEVAKLVVEIKAELEKIREQVQNIE